MSTYTFLVADTVKRFLLKKLESFFQRLAFVGRRGWSYSVRPHPYFSGFRKRLYHIGIGFGWLDTSPKSALYHFRVGFMVGKYRFPAHQRS